VHGESRIKLELYTYYPTPLVLVLPPGLPPRTFFLPAPFLLSYSVLIFFLIIRFWAVR